MTRGRDSTVAHARSPRLAITLRGLKILEHPKTRPELWGVVVPWVRVRVKTGRAYLVDATDAAINAQRDFGGGWLLPEHEGDVARRMSGRAMRQMVESWQFHFVVESPVSSRDKVGIIAFPVFLLLVILALVACLVHNVEQDMFTSWPGVVQAVVIGLPIAAVAAFLLKELYAGMCAVRRGARRVVYSPDAVELEFDEGRVKRLEWQSIRGVRPRVSAVAITTDQGQEFWLRSRQHLFLLWASMDRLDPSRASRHGRKASVIRLFLVVQLLAVLGAAAAYAMRMADPLTHMPSPFEFWVMIALFMPVFVLVPGYAFHQLEKRVFLPRRRARARLRRRGGTVSLNGGKGTLDG